MASSINDPAISLLRDLVAIDSVNPSLAPGAAGEGQIADFIESHLRRLGLDVEKQEAAPGRPNVIGVLEGPKPGPSLMFCGHTDTVGVSGMTAPFDPVERDGRIYGRGSQDMKAGVAAMIDAARVARDQGFTSGRLILAAVVDEEFGSIGADALVTAWSADAAVVTEPTDLEIGIAHKGFAWASVETHGRAAHGSRPLEGRDAILMMGRALQRFEQLDRDLQAGQTHPLLGTASLHASIIDGGRELSSYPALCRLKLERRTLPGEDGDTFRREIQGILTTLAEEDAEFSAAMELMFARPAYQIAADDWLPQALIDAARRSGIRTAAGGLSFWTDAAVLASAGIPSVLFGPGGAGLHSTEEYVTVADVIACRDALAGLAGSLKSVRL